MAELDALYGDRVNIIYSTEHALREAVKQADLVIGAVLIPGASAPKLITREMLATMKPGSVLVDISIDQGGCFETSKPTTHDDPIYIIDDVVHYCVANMPGGVPQTSTYALTNATLPYILRLAKDGVQQTLAADAHFRSGVNVADGYITYEAVARDLDLPFRTYEIPI